MPKEATTTERDNEMGARNVHVVSSKVWSFSDYNKNVFWLVDNKGMKLPATAGELSALEQGHYYIAKKVAADVWEVTSPFRYADEDTALLFATVTPIPCNTKLLNSFGNRAHRWQAVEDKFQVVDGDLKVMEQVIEKAGGLLEKVTYDKMVAKAYLTDVNEQKTLAEADLLRAQAGTADLSISPEELGNLADVIHGRWLLLSRSLDGVKRHLQLSQATSATGEERQEIQQLYTQAKKSQARVGEIHELVKQLFGERIKVAAEKLSTATPKTLEELLGVLAGSMPALKHVKLEGNTLLIEYEPNRFVRVTEDGAKLWDPDDDKGPGGETFLELD